MSEFTYTIKEANEDPLNSIIEKTGVTSVEFTALDLINTRMQLDKNLRRDEAQVQAFDLEFDRLRSMMPILEEVDKLSDTDFTALGAYCHKMELKKKALENIEHTKKGLENIEKLIPDITSQTGIEIPVASPYSHE